MRGPGKRIWVAGMWALRGVIPKVPTRQWVLTVPWGRRWLLARNPILLGGVHRIAMRIIERWYAREANPEQRRKRGESH